MVVKSGYRTLTAQQLASLKPFTDVVSKENASLWQWYSFFKIFCKHSL
jgi:hypothetical protein